MAGVHGKKEKRVWIDSQTEEEIMRGIREAKNLSAYDNLSASAYLRAKEDYLMGINFSRELTLRYGNSVSNYLNTKYQAISVGRVMTCVLGMVVRREREIRAFVKTPFYRVLSSIALEGENFEGEWRAVEGSRYFQTPYLYKENGFKEKAYAEKLIQELSVSQPLQCTVEKIERKLPVLKKRKRVAAYARVSIESERMQHSLSAQVSYYSALIQKNSEWEYAGVFADYGISGTDTKKREEFNRMLAECEAGNIDIILTKSIPRFARNTVDLLNTVRPLKDLGIEVRFEK